MGDGGYEIGTGDDSPWAHEQPVPAEPIEFDWGPSERPGSEWAPTSSPTPAAGAPAPQGPASGSPPSGPPAPAIGPGAAPVSEGLDRDSPFAALFAGGSRRRLALIGTLGVVALIVGVLALARDDPSIDAPAASDPATTAADSVPASTLPDITLVPPDDVLTEDTTPRRGGGAAEDTPEWTETTIDLPPEIRALRGVTTIVTVSEDGLYSEIEVPSGRVDSIQLRRDAATAQLVVGATSTLLASTSGSNASISYLLRVGQPPIELRLGAERNDLVAIPTTDEYVATVFGFGDGTTYRELRVYPDGSTQTLELGDRVPPWQRTYAPTGELLVNDAGGVYRIDAEGAATRVSDGMLLAVSTNHLLVRECSETYNCGTVLIDALTGERRAVQLDEETDNDAFAGIQPHVSPDGTASHHQRWTPTGGREDIIVDLDTGIAVTVPSPRPGAFADVWAADSSGVFVSGEASGLNFLDRTGEATAFADDVGVVNFAAVRPRYAAPPPPPPQPITSGLSIIGLGREGDVHRIDIDTGAVITTSAPPLASGAPAYVFADPDGATIVSYDDVPSIRFDAASDTTRFAETTPRGPMVTGPLPGTVWSLNRQVGPDDPMTLDLIDASGNPVGVTIDAGPDTELLGSDGTGGVLVTSSLGGAYVFTADGVASRVTPGEVLAIGATAAYVRECDDQFACGIYRLDRATGERVLTDVPALDIAGGDVAAGSPFGQSVSPDGNVAFVRVSGFGADWMIVDLGSSTAVPAPGASVGSPMLWSDDSQWALYLSGDVLRLYDRASGSLRTLNNLPELKAFGPAFVPAFDPPADAGETPPLEPAEAPADEPADGGGASGLGGPFSS